ncbi:MULTISPECIES: alpha/beta fold hydrolase [Streptacidiphilus]|uniref:Alpha/beta fold hydrolase n=1 Tax=Streptacidiphilus cavernicola TaxID=3342716 RepID=A0ABV6UR31_9ACTN|nr:alpha/beta hydrolase [Streptacidiphilus jeojiense]
MTSTAPTTAPTPTAFATSKDGTAIAYERIGSGPAVILVDGALCYRASGPARPLAAALARHFTVYTYDRRGRGESGNTLPYAVEREVEDLAAVLEAAGGSAHLYGISSGAAVALEAANVLPDFLSLALYEYPLAVDANGPVRPADYIETMDALVAAGKRGATVKMFLRTVGVPSAALLVMQLLPVWSKLKGVAHTLPYDMRVLGDTGSGRPLPTDRWTGATLPTLVMDGGKSPQPMRDGMRQLADVLPGSEYRTLPGQTHMLKPDAVAPVLTEFFQMHQR